MQGKIALAIVTKNRPLVLEKCLDSISRQNLLPDKVFIIDNDPLLSAQKIAKQKKYQALNINYIPSRGSVPHCRNYAINEAKTTYLGFIDDDCVLEKAWLKNALKTIQNQKTAYILGKTLLLNPQNIFALAQFAHDDYWKDYSGQIFDTKNVLLNLNTIKKRRLKFDEKCQKDHYDSADFDFNFQVKKAGLPSSFSPKMRLSHQETEGFARFSKRAFARGYLAKYLNDKWQLQDQLVDFGQKNLIIWLLKIVKKFTGDYQKYSQHMGKSSTVKKMMATLLIKVFEHYYTRGYVAKRT